jgi:23S rRNA pseudouridine955/2504/2580 synthase
MFCMGTVFRSFVFNNFGRFLVLRLDYQESPRLVHRLDKDTTGILVLARSRSSAAQMYRRFYEHAIEKTVRLN